MSVIKFGTSEYVIEFDNGPSDSLYATQGETARTLKFRIIDLNHQAIDTSNITLK